MFGSRPFAKTIIVYVERSLDCERFYSLSVWVLVPCLVCYIDIGPEKVVPESSLKSFEEENLEEVS